MRPSAHGDVIHSRPIAINYGTDASPKVVVFYGGNDGVLRAVNGNRTANIGTGGNAVPARRSGRSCRRSSTRRSSGCATTRRTINFTGHDGDVADTAAEAVRHGRTRSPRTTTTSLFVGMRRGGRVLYAFDVTRHCRRQPG